MGDTKLVDASFRKALVEGGEAAVQASTDPLIVLARKVDPWRRKMIKAYEDQVESVETPREKGLARRASRPTANPPTRTRPSPCGFPSAPSKAIP